MHRKPFATCALTTALLTSGVGLHAQLPTPTTENTPQAARCGPAALRGSYGFFRTGVNPQGAIAAVGIGHFDGDGGMTTAQTTSRNGVVTQGSFPGRYEVAADCSGAWYDAAGTVIAHFVLLDGGNEFFFLSTSAGNTITGNGKLIVPWSR